MTAYVKNASVAPHLVDDGDPPAIALLKDDHQIFRTLFDLVETAGDDALFPMAGEICIRLAVHMNLEEDLLYPALRLAIDPRQLDEALGEHQLVKRLISDIMGMTGEEPRLRATMHALGVDVVRHIDDEDGAVLRDARNAWEDGKVDLVRIGILMQRRRRDLFTLVGSVAAERRAFDLELGPEAVERLQHSGSRVNGASSPELADVGTDGQR